MGGKRPHNCSECGRWHYPARSDDIADKANGAKVPRCAECGSSVDVLRFGLFLEGKPAGQYRLCGACFYHSNPIDPQAGDPLRAA